MGNDAAAEKLRLYRQSVLDSVTTDLSSMVSRLGTEDAKKVQGHLDAIAISRSRSRRPAAVTINCKAAPAARRSGRQGSDDRSQGGQSCRSI